MCECGCVPPLNMSPFGWAKEFRFRKGNEWQMANMKNGRNISLGQIIDKATESALKMIQWKVNGPSWSAKVRNQ